MKILTKFHFLILMIILGVHIYFREEFLTYILYFVVLLLELSLDKKKSKAKSYKEYWIYPILTMVLLSVILYVFFGILDVGKRWLVLTTPFIVVISQNIFSIRDMRRV